jgi:hypothetical protein
MVPRGIPGSTEVPINLAFPTPPLPFSYRLPDAVVAGGTSTTMAPPPPPPPASNGAVATYHMPPLLGASHFAGPLLPVPQLAASLDVDNSSKDSSAAGYGGFFQALGSSLGPIILPSATVSASPTNLTAAAVPVVRPLASHHPARAAAATAGAAASSGSATLPPVPVLVPKAAVPVAGKSTVEAGPVRSPDWQRALSLAEARQVTRGQLTWRDAMQYKIAPVDLNSRQRAMLRRQQAIDSFSRPADADDALGAPHVIRHEDAPMPKRVTATPPPHLSRSRTSSDPVATLAAAAAALAAQSADQVTSSAASADADVLAVETGGDVVEIVATTTETAATAAATAAASAPSSSSSPSSPATAGRGSRAPKTVVGESRATASRVVRRNDVDLRMEAARAGLAAARVQGSGDASDLNRVLVFTKNGGRRGPSSTIAAAAAYAASVRQHDDPTAQMIATSRFRSTSNNRSPSLKGTDPGSVVENVYCASLPASRFRHPYDHCRFIADALLADVLSLVSDLFSLVVELGAAAMVHDPVGVARLPLRQVRRPDEVAPLSLFRSRKRIALYLTSEVLATFQVMRTLATKPAYVAVAAQVRLEERMKHLESRIDSLTRFSRARHVVCVHSDFSRAHRLSYNVVEDAHFSPGVRAAMAAAADGKPHEPVGGRLHRPSVKSQQRSVGMRRWAAKAPMPLAGPSSDGARHVQPEDDDDDEDMADLLADEDQDASAMDDEDQDMDGSDDNDDDGDNDDDDAHGESAASTLVALAGRT